MMDVKTISKQHILTLSVTSSAFLNDSMIPHKFTCDGENVNPPLEIANIPKETKSLALIMEDQDSPIRPWTHWLVWNIHPTPKIKQAGTIGIEGLTDFGQYHYGGPCPNKGIHRYHFKVYSLNEMLNIREGSTRHDLEKAMRMHIIAFGELVGLYGRG